MSVDSNSVAIGQTRQGRSRRASWATTISLRNPWVWVAGITLVAFVMRRIHLGAESLWFDEADIVAMARQPLPRLLESFGRAGENGPLYTLMLHYWLAAADRVPGVMRAMHLLFGGAEEAPIRGLAMLFGTAAIPVMYALARRVGGVALGIASAALLAINPFHLWYSQDAKMYSLLVLTTLASSLLYLEALQRNRLSLWVGYVLATWVMLTTHSMAGLVLASQLAATPFLARLPHTASGDSPTSQPSRSRGRWVRWGWAMLLVVGPIFPILWLRAAALVTGTVDTGNWYTSTTLPDILLTVFVKFAVNEAPPWHIGDGFVVSWEMLGALAMGLLALVGAWALLWRRGREERGPVALLLMLWALPVVLFWLVTLWTPLFHPRYLIMSLPPYLILAAAGLLALWRRAPWLATIPGVVLAVCTVAALLGVNYAATPQKEDWRDAMVYVQDHIRLRDVMVVFPGYLETAVKQYYRPGGPSHIPERPIETVKSLRTANYGPRELEDDLRKAVQCQERAWVIVSPVREEAEDPEHRVVQWFQYNWHTFDTKVFNGVTVYGIAFNGTAYNCWFIEPDWPEVHRFQNGLEFAGYIYELRDDDDTPTQPDASYLPLTLYWRANRKLDADYEIRIKVADPAGKVVKDEALGPLNGYWPTSQWPVGYPIFDYRDLRLPGGLTPGDYSVSIQVFPKGQPDAPLQLEDGGTEFTLKQPLKVVPWRSH